MIEPINQTAESATRHEHTSEQSGPQEVTRKKFAPVVLTGDTPQPVPMRRGDDDITRFLVHLVDAWIAEGESDRSFAARAGIAISNVSQWRHGIHSAATKTQAGVAEAIGVQRSKLLELAERHARGEHVDFEALLKKLANAPERPSPKERLAAAPKTSSIGERALERENANLRAQLATRERELEIARKALNDMRGAWEDAQRAFAFTPKTPGRRA